MGHREDVENQGSGAIGRPSRWSCGTLMVLTVHTFLIATCLTLFFTGFRIGPEAKKTAESAEPTKPTEPANTKTTGLILLLENRGGIKPVHTKWSNVKQGSLHFKLLTNEINNIKVNNSDIKVGCQGPYIIYPYIQHDNEKESFNITVVKGEKVLHSMHFSTENRATWKHMILDLDQNDHISVFVSCSLTCPFVGQLCLALNFLLGSACAQ